MTTKKYILTEDDVTSTLDTSENVIESGAVKTVMDTKLTKVTSATTYEQAYGKDDSGDQAMYNISNDVVANSLVKRSATGQVAVPLVPSVNASATSKSYVDSELEDKVDKVTSETTYDQAYIKDTDGDQGMMNITDSVLASSIVERTSEGHVNVPVTPTSNSSATSKQYVDTALNTKQDKVTGKGLSTNDYTTDEKNKLATIEEHAQKNVQSDWAITDSDEEGYIINKPFQTIGTGLTVTNNVLSVSGVGLQIRVVERLPTTGDPNTIYFVPNGSGQSRDVYDEYIYVNGSWEKIGTTKFTLNIDQTSSGIVINDIELQKANSGTTGLLSAHDWNIFDAKQDALVFDNTPRTGSSNPVKSSGIKTALDAKANIADYTELEERLSEVEEALDDIEPGAQANVQSDWDEANTNSDAYIKNKPTSFPIEDHASSHVNGEDDIQTANSTRKGLLSKEDWAMFNGKQNALTWDDTPTLSSTNPVKSNGIKIELNKKVDIEQGVAKSGYFLRVNSSGNVVAQSYDPSDVDFENIGGSPYDNTNLSNALNSKVDTTTKVGSSALSSDITASALANDTKEVTVTFKNKTIDADDNVISDLTTTNFKGGVIVSSFQSTPTNTALPTEKLVKDSLDAKLDDTQLVTVWSPTTSNTKIASEKLVKDTIDTKVSISQGTSKAGYILKVNSSGNVEAVEGTESSPDFIDITGDPYDNENLSDALDAKQNKVLYGTTDPASTLGENGDIYIKYEA